MGEHEKRGKKKQEKVEQKHRTVKQESQPVFDHFHAWEQSTAPIRETPFQPRMDEHAELIARATSDEHRANLVLQLQQTYGNRYVQRLIKSRVVQAKLSVSAPNDIYEQEADRVAKAVTRVDNSQVQRQVEEDEEMLQGKATQVQRQVEEEEEEPLQAKIQRQVEEEEEPLQAKIQRQVEEEEEPLQAKIQRQVEEEEEPLQAKIQRQVEEEEEPLQAKIQRQVEEEEEPLQTKIQRQVEEEEEPLQTKLASEVQRQEEPEEEEEEEPVQTKATGSQPATVNEDLEARIKAERGGGHPLSDNTREPMEQSFGTDFSGVRVHSDSEADTLNKQLSAKAFTTGQDVFFRQGEYSPGSDSGKELIAHELTHVVQQTGGQKVQSKTGVEQSSTPLVRLRRRIKGFVQRLSFQDTNWENAKKATVSGSGGAGVVFFEEDGSKLVVKPGSEVAPEVTIAANLAGGMLGKDTGWPIDAPKSRLASSDEAQRIKNKASQLLEKEWKQKWVRLPKFFRTKVKGKEKWREEKVLEHFDKFRTVVSEYAPGVTLTKLTEGLKLKHTKRRWWQRDRSVKGMTAEQKRKEMERRRKGKGKARDTFLTRMWKNPDLMKTMGKATAMDIFMGNGDRLAGIYNPDNLKISVNKRAFHLVDNAQVTQMNYFTTKIFPWETTTAKQAFAIWLAQDLVKQFIDDDFPSVADHVVNDVLRDGIKDRIRKQDKFTFIRLWNKNSDKMKGWFIEGLKNGKQLLLETIKDPLSLVSGVPKKHLVSALTSVWARRLALLGGGDRWDDALYMAKAQLGVGWGEEEKD
jgi:hypothetical protein